MLKRYRNEISVSKDVLPELSNDYIETTLGDKRGAKRQFRTRATNVHIREYDDKFTIHIDRENPIIHPVRHILRDSPESIVAAGVSLLLAGEKKRKRDLGNAKANGRFSHPAKFDLFGIFTIFILLNGTLGVLKEILFG